MMKMTDLDLGSKRVLIRQDLNVPLKNGKVDSDQRIRASLPTIQWALDKSAMVILMSHLGRPVEGSHQAEFSLVPVARHLEKLLDQSVELSTNYLNTLLPSEPGKVILLENVRFNIGEKSDDESLAKKYATLCDVFVMDAFGTAHRAQASTHGVAKYAAIACAGPLLTAELDALDTALKAPKPPTIAIVGGSKVSTKLTVLDALSAKVDLLVPGGGIANTFIAASGYGVGKSLYEPRLIEAAQKLMQRAKNKANPIPIPTDVVVGQEFDPATSAEVKPVDQISANDMVFDIGPETAATYAEIMRSAGTIVWNGPVGVFEFDQFSHGTRILGQAIAQSNAFSIAGGGDTLAAVDKFNLGNSISYISTGGGAFLEFLEGKTLPAVAALQSRCATDSAIQ